MGVGKEVSFKETFYVSHGNPAMLADESFIARNFLLGWKKNVFPIKPKSILVVSAHWETDVPSASAGEHPDVIYDFSDVPDGMFQKYGMEKRSTYPSFSSSYCRPVDLV